MTFGRREAAVAIGLAFAIGMGVLRYVNGADNPVIERAEWWVFDDVALAAALAAPALLGVISRRRPAALIAAGSASLLLGMSPLLFTVVLLVPGLLYLLPPRPRDPLHLRDTAVILVVLAFALVPFAALILDRGPMVCWKSTGYRDGTTRHVVDRSAARETENGGAQTSELAAPEDDVISSGGGCTDGVVRPRTSALMIGSVAVSVGAAAAFSSRQVSEEP